MPPPWSSWPRSSVDAIHGLLMQAIQDGISHFAERRLVASGIVLSRGVRDFMDYYYELRNGFGWLVPVRQLYGIQVGDDPVDGWGPSMFRDAVFYPDAEESSMRVVAEGYGFVRSAMRVRDSVVNLRLNVDVLSHNGRSRTISDRYVAFYGCIDRERAKKRAGPTPRELWFDRRELNLE